MTTKIPKSNQTILKLSATLLLFLLLTFILFNTLGLKINFSKSYPIGIYQTFHKTKIEQGDFVILCPPNSPLMQAALKRRYLLPGSCDGGFYPLLKKVVALEGDVVEINDTVYIDNKEIPNSRLLSYDANHNPLPSLKNTRRKLLKSEIFVMSDYYEKSFDSRYFGEVNEACVLKHIQPLYIFTN